MRSCSTNCSAASALNWSWKRCRRLFVAVATPDEKHGILESWPIMATRSMMLSAERRSADGTLCQTCHVLSSNRRKGGHSPWNACLHNLL